MTEITRVPLKPVAPGSLTKLWLGVLLAVLAGAGIAWTAMPKGPPQIEITTLTEGEGPTIAMGDVAWIKYVGKKASDGEVFDQTPELPPQIAALTANLLPEGQPMPMQDGAFIPGFQDGLQQMQKGGKYELFIPAEQAYGSSPPPGGEMLADEDLIFEIEVTDIMSQEAYERNMAILQQMIQGGMMGGGPGGPPPGGE